MGTRINVEIGPKDNVAAILFSNSHHPNFDAEKIVRQIVAEEQPGFAGTHGLSGITEKLLSIRYTAHGGHQKGDRMFVVDTEPGDREKVLRVTYNWNTQSIEVTEERP